MIARTGELVKSVILRIRERWHDLFVLSCVALIAFISYNLGAMNALQKKPITLEQGVNIYTAGGQKEDANEPPEQGSGQPRDERVVVSKNSTFYHHPWCSGAKRIKESNKIWFPNETAAQQAGYTLAGNCQ